MSSDRAVLDKRLIEDIIKNINVRYIDVKGEGTRVYLEGIHYLTVSNRRELRSMKRELSEIKKRTGLNLPELILCDRENKHFNEHLRTLGILKRYNVNKKCSRFLKRKKPGEKAYLLNFTLEEDESQGDIYMVLTEVEGNYIGRGRCINIASQSVENVISLYNAGTGCLLKNIYTKMEVDSIKIQEIIEAVRKSSHNSRVSKIITELVDGE